DATHGVRGADMPRRGHVDAGGARDLRQAERRVVRRRQLARDALVPEQVGAVRGHVNDETMVGERQRLEEGSAGRGVGGELEDAVVLLAQAELARAAQHPLRYLAAELGPRSEERR